MRGVVCDGVAEMITNQRASNDWTVEGTPDLIACPPPMTTRIRHYRTPAVSVTATNAELAPDQNWFSEITALAGPHQPSDHVSLCLALLKILRRGSYLQRELETERAWPSRVLRTGRGGHERLQS